MTNTEQLRHEIDMDTHQIEVCKERKRVNLRLMDTLNKRETVNYMKQFIKGE